MAKKNTTDIILSIPVHIENINKPISIYELVFDAFENNRVNEILAKNEILREFWDSELKYLDESYYDLYIGLISNKLHLLFKNISEENKDDDKTFSITDTKLEGSLGVSFTLSANVTIDLLAFKQYILSYANNANSKLVIKSIYGYISNSIIIEIDNQIVFDILDFGSGSFIDELFLNGYNYSQGSIKINSYIEYNAIKDTIRISMTIDDNIAGHYDEDWANDLLKVIPESLAIKKKYTNGYTEVELIIEPLTNSEINILKYGVIDYLGSDIIDTWKDYVQSESRLKELISSKNESNLDRSENCINYDK